MITEKPREIALELMYILIRHCVKNLPPYAHQNCGLQARLFLLAAPSSYGIWETYVPQRIESITLMNNASLSG
ncbi:hypothetical protein [Candidatus Vallotia lariciata]|uniref:hypothetical protein n=1 Tax=Candidatus Vallotia laricis TaxID=2018052 RepID=UPI001D005579|nr:hypothetical protein [Candidatus Vallotia lariciata]UDG83212.1 hypothetical protein GKR41_00602 [Candidatus Vallotia lariciata]